MNICYYCKKVGLYRVIENTQLPQLGMRVDMFCYPLPTITEIILFPMLDTVDKYKIKSDHIIHAIAFVS